MNTDDFQKVDSEKNESPLTSGGYKKPYFAWGILVINIIMWLGIGNTEDPKTLLRFGAMFGPLVAEGDYWRLFTAMFLHVGFVHLAFNAFGLFIFGQLVEKTYGHSRFLMIYVLSGLFGSTLSYIMNSIAIAAGASGAIFGILGSLAAFLVVNKNMFGQIGRQNLTGLSILVIINIIYGLVTPGIDNWAHIGGFGSGFVLGMLVTPKYQILQSPILSEKQLIKNTAADKTLWIIPASTALLIVLIYIGTVTLPDNPHTHLYKADRLFKETFYERALGETTHSIRFYEDLNQFYMHMPEVYLLHAKILIKLGNPQEALKYLSIAMTLGTAETKKDAMQVWETLRRQ